MQYVLWWLFGFALVVVLAVVSVVLLVATAEVSKRVDRWLMLRRLARNRKRKEDL